MLSISHFTVHEAECAFYHAWHDGIAVTGPLPRHQLAPFSEQFRAGLSIEPVEPTTEPANTPFGEWRHSASPFGIPHTPWRLSLSLPLAAIADAKAQVTSFPPLGMPVIVVCRFLCGDTGHWRVLEFHDARLTSSPVSEDNQNMMRALTFEAGWMEERIGSSLLPAPDLAPIPSIVAEYRHLGRRIRCWEYLPYANEWHECPENRTGPIDDPARYIHITHTPTAGSLSYMAARTDPVPGMEDVDLHGIGWVFEHAIATHESGGLTLADGWSVQPGAAELIALHPSALHWEHPRVVIRHLGRIYATIGSGHLATPAWHPFPPAATTALPARIGPLIILPHGTFFQGA